MSHAQSPTEWAQAQLGHPCQIDPIYIAAADRRYYQRLFCGTSSYMLMISDTKAININKIIYSHDLLKAAKIPIASIIALEKNQGWILFTDAGQEHLISKATQKNSSDYQKAITLACQLANSSHQLKEIPQLNTDHIHQQLQQTEQWYMATAIKPDQKLTLAWRTLCERVYQDWDKLHLGLCHTDYHGENIMIHNNDLIILDYQDLCLGPQAYDIASLIFEHYTNHSSKQQHIWIQQSARLFKQPLSIWRQAVLLCALQRHMKNLGIFSRLYYRDLKLRYRDYIQPTALRIHNLANQIGYKEGIFFQEKYKLLEC